MDSVQNAIERADLTTDFEVTQGSCQSIANAIKDVFGGQIVAVSSRKDVQSVDHAMVRIDGDLYDGRGKVTKEMVCNEFAKGYSGSFKEKDRYLWEVDGYLSRFRGAEYDDARDRLGAVK